MATSTTKTNKPLNPRGNDQSPLAFNRAKLYSGKALDFDGVNDYVDVPYLDSLANTGVSSTFSFYFNADTLTGNMVLAEQRKDTSNRYVVWYNHANPQIQLYMNSSVYAVNFPLTETGRWFYFTGVVDGSTAKMYINGELIGSTSYIPFESNVDFYLGTYNSASGFFYNGKMSNAKIFNTALTAAQVADLYNNPEKVVPTGVDNTALKLWLPMMEGAGTTAYDGSGNGNHGTISGATYVNGVGSPVAQSAVMDWNKASNYIDKSEEFETASWSENRLVTITDDSFIAPDGSATATEIIETTANDSHFLSQTLSVTAGDYFISVYAKKRDYDWIQLSTGGDTSRYANFNISTGATGNANGITDLIIQDAGNGWYRIGGKITTSSTSFNYFVTLIQSDVASRFQTYTGTDKGQYIWGAQATKSATLKPYLRNIGTAAITDDVLLPQGLTTGRDITGVNLFENVRKQGALNLDGNSWAEVHDNASLDVTTGLTLEAWVYFDEDVSLNGKGILAKWVGSGSSRCYMIYLDSLNRLRLYINGGSSTGIVMTGKNWYHVVGTFDQSNRKVYINGSLEATDADNSTINASDLPLEIGRYSDLAANAYNNDIAQPRIYNRALTAEEVQRSYDSGKNIFTNS